MAQDRWFPCSPRAVLRHVSESGSGRGRERAFELGARFVMLLANGQEPGAPGERSNARSPCKWRVIKESERSPCALRRSAERASRQ